MTRTLTVMDGPDASTDLQLVDEVPVTWEQWHRLHDDEEEDEVVEMIRFHQPHPAQLIA